MPRPSALVAAPAIAVLGLAALPAVGTASTVAPAAPCVSSLFQNGTSTRQPMTGTITGGVPGGLFTISGKGGEASFFSGTFDAAGNAQYAITSYGTSGIKPSKGRTVTLEVKEPINGVSVVTGSAQIKKSLIALQYDITSPKSLKARRSVKVSGTPFANANLYGFVVRKKGGKTVKRVSLGKSNACGYTSRKVAFFDTSRPGTGAYTLYVNASKKLDKNTAVSRGFTVVKRRRFF